MIQLVAFVELSQPSRNTHQRAREIVPSKVERGLQSVTDKESRRGIHDHSSHWLPEV
jgi:hypothetical protein